MLDVLATYVHDLDPVIFSISEKIKLRWYGLSYVLGFAAAYYILLRLSRRQLWVVAEEKVADVVTFTAIFGVFLGGRIGYVLFYMLPEPGGLEKIMSDPLVIVAVWKGGMASHGGILGIMLFTLFYSWRHKLSWPALGDGFAIVAPLGVFFGRIANFINGELHGTLTDEKNWYAVKFPQSLYQEGNEENLQSALREAALTGDERVAEVLTPFQDVGGYYQLPFEYFHHHIEPIARDNPAVLEALGNHTPARHPSQLYEGVLEGLLVFLILYGMRVFLPKIWHGVISGSFFIIYAVFRILVENVREPDSARVLGVTKGQFYSYFMIVIGIGFLVYAWKSRKSFKDVAGAD